MNIYKDFLPKDVFKKLKDTMMGDYFPWYFNHLLLLLYEKVKKCVGANGWIL
jgi:hypothetical protein